jgi:hypothetical protein
MCTVGYLLAVSFRQHQYHSRALCRRSVKTAPITVTNSARHDPCRAARGKAQLCANFDISRAFVARIGKAEPRIPRWAPIGFSFGDTSTDPGLRFDRARGSKEPLIPDLYLLAEIAKWEKARRSLKIYKGPPFLEREKKLFWRGSTTGPFINSFEEFCANHRVQACLHTIRELPAHADCKIARIVQTPAEIQQDVRRFLKKNKILSRIIDPRNFAQYQMFLDLPGNASAWGSSLRYLQGMLVFRVAHQYELLYYEALQPWAHYIPVAADLSDLKAGVEWALLHQREAAQIAANGQACMLEFLTRGEEILQNVLRDQLRNVQRCA